LVDAEDPVSAINYATFKIEQCDWAIVEVETASARRKCIGNVIVVEHTGINYDGGPPRLPSETSIH
jgi:hypothetical protein